MTGRPSAHNRPHPAATSRERQSDFDIRYSYAVSDGRRLRIIITRPGAGGVFPAIFFLQGHECSSIDLAGRSNHPYAELLYGLTRRGYVTVRMEKSGVGDSEGVHCSKTDFFSEVTDYVNTLKHVFRLRYVDTHRIFLFGYSTGGIIVFGTISKTWMEYTLENTRRQMHLARKDAAAIHDALNALFHFHYLFTVERHSPRGIAARHPALKALAGDGSLFYGRHHSFFRQIAGINLAQVWEQVKCPVLAMWGKGDFLSSYDDHRLIYDIVTQNHPSAKTKLIKLNSDHFFRETRSIKQSYSNKHVSPFNAKIVHEIAQWCGNASFP